MAVPLNRLPSGLLDYFGIKSGEWGPRELGQQLVPTIDLRDWYLQARALNVTLALPNPAADGRLVFDATATTPTELVGLVTAGQLIVPQDEYWWITRLCCRTIGNGSANAGMTQPLFRTGGVDYTPPLWHSPAPSVPMVGADNTENNCGLLSPILMQPGERLSFLSLYIEGFAVLARTGSMAVVRMKA